jgi:hypothetical protein
VVWRPVGDWHRQFHRCRSGQEPNNDRKQEQTGRKTLEARIDFDRRSRAAATVPLERSAALFAAPPVLSLRPIVKA